MDGFHRSSHSRGKSRFAYSEAYQVFVQIRISFIAFALRNTRLVLDVSTGNFSTIQTSNVLIRSPKANSWLRDGSEQERKVSHVRKIASCALGEISMVFLFILPESWHRCKIETHQTFTFFICIFIKNHSTGEKVTLNASRT